MNYETFLQDLHAARDRAQRFRRHAHAQEQDSAALALALEELDVTLEELRVAEEEVRVQQEALDDGRAEGELDRQHFQALFLLAPAPYLVTDRAGVIRQANLRAAGLLGVDSRFVAGKPLASFVDPGDRPRFRGRLSRLPGTEGGEWRVRLRPRDRDPVQVVASVAVGRDHAGVASELRWLLWPPLDDQAGPGGPRAPRPRGLWPGRRPGRRGWTAWPMRCMRWWTRPPSCWGPTGPG